MSTRRSQWFILEVLAGIAFAAAFIWLIVSSVQKYEGVFWPSLGGCVVTGILMIVIAGRNEQVRREYAKSRGEVITSRSEALAEERAAHVNEKARKASNES